MKSNIKETFKQKKISELNGEAKEAFNKNIISIIEKDLEKEKDRFLFFVPDLDLVNPLTKLMYDVALETKKFGYNAYIVHEKQGFSPTWLLSYKKEYKKIPVLYTTTKAGAKSERLKASFQIKITDSIFVPDVHLELIQDFSSIKEFAVLQKTLIVTGYSGLYSLNPGQSLKYVGIDNTICFDAQVYQDYQMLFPDVKHYLSLSYKDDDLKNVNLNENPDYVKEPYILISGVGNNEKINQLVNIFYNRYPSLKFLKFKIINRKSYTGFLLNIKDALVFVDFDRIYVTNTNSAVANKFRTHYISTNGFENNNFIENNIITEETANNLFDISEVIKNVFILSATRTDKKFKEETMIIKPKIKELFESCIIQTMLFIRQDKVDKFKKIIE